MVYPNFIGTPGNIKTPDPIASRKPLASKERRRFLTNSELGKAELDFFRSSETPPPRLQRVSEEKNMVEAGGIEPPSEYESRRSLRV